MGRNTLRNRTILVFISAFLGLALMGCASTPQTGSQPQGPAPAAIDIPRVSLEESRAAYDSGEATFVDVRSEASYSVSHIPGALSIPLAELEARIGELDPEQWIITYCT